MNRDQLATRIATLRKQAGLTQTQAARNAHISALGWSRWESARFQPQAWRMGEIAAAIGVPIAALYAPEGTHAIADVVITTNALQRVQQEGAPETRALINRIATNLEPAIRTAATQHAANHHARPIARAPRVRPPRRKRSRPQATADDSNTS